MTKQMMLSVEEFVRSLYLGVLGREPDRIGYDSYVSDLRNACEKPERLVYKFLTSEEFLHKHAKQPGALTDISLDDLRVYPGYSIRDLELFKQFDTSEVRPSKGFLTDWVGSRVRMTSLWRGIEEFENKVTPLPIPGDYHADVIEWVGTLKAVLAAPGPSFSVMELGAGYGPWLSAACAAARLRGVAELHLCGVEADPARFQMLQQNMADNDLAGPNTRLCQAGIGVHEELARWPSSEDPANHSGGRLMREGNADDEAYHKDGFAHMKLIEVQIIPLSSLLAERPIWDLVHIDIQGTEHDLCSGCIIELSERVRYIVVGTHSRKLDGDLMDLFLGAGWVLENEKPARMIYRPDTTLTSMTISDGAQVWRNPRH